MDFNCCGAMWRERHGECPKTGAGAAAADTAPARVSAAPAATPPAAAITPRLLIPSPFAIAASLSRYARHATSYSAVQRFACRMSNLDQRPAISPRAITCAWISAAPSKMFRMRASHSTRLISYSSA